MAKVVAVMENCIIAGFGVVLCNAKVCTWNELQVADGEIEDKDVGVVERIVKVRG